MGQEIMDEIKKESLKRHIQGAIVVHRSPFASIEVPSVEDALSTEQCDKWVAPFYRVSFSNVDNDFVRSLKGIYPEIAPAMVELLLTDFNWRPRLTGAFFAALKRFISFEDHIGRLLLRSDVCFAGKLYCVALAEFNTPTGLDYLKRYLEYYLTKPDLDFDQGDAMGAVAHLDARNGTKHLDSFMPLWNSYVDAKSWKPDLAEQIAIFSDEMKALTECRTQVEPTR